MERKIAGQSLTVWFKIIFMITTLIRLNPWIGRHFMPAFTWIMAPVGLIIILLDLWNKNAFFNSDYSIFLIFFIGVYFISTFLNYTYGFMGNLKVLFWLVWMFIFAYSYDKSASKKSVVDLFVIISKITVVFSFVLSIISLFMLFCNYQYVKYYPDGTYTIMGVLDGRLYGAIWDPNYGSVFASVAIILSLYLILQNTKGFFQKPFLISNIILQYLYMTFTNSRSGKICMLICLVFFLTGYVFDFWNNKLAWRQTIIKIASISIIIVLVSTAQAPIRNVTNIIRESFNALMQFNDNDLQNNNLYELTEDDRAVIIEGNNFAAGRIKIWSGAIELWMSKPILGTTFKGYIPYAENNFPENYLALTKHAIHNDYIKILLSTGVVGFAIIAGFAFRCAHRILIFLKKRNSNYQETLLVWCILTILVTFVTAGFFLDILIFNYYWSVFLFWWLLGLLVFLTASEPNKDTLIYIFVNNIMLKVKRIIRK